MHIGPGLFESLTGHFANGAAISDFSPQTQTFLSVQDNIQRILNSRRNSLAHLPDYGLDDLTNIYAHLPSSSPKLLLAIKHTLLKYEPRVADIDIEIGHTEPGMLLSFTMVCTLRQSGLVRFGTHFAPDGHTRLTMLKADSV